MEIIPRSPNARTAFQIKPVRLILGVIAVLGVVMVLFSLLFGFVSIPTNSVGVKIRFGAYLKTENPGLCYAIPHVDEIIVVPTQRLLKLEFGFASENASNPYQGDTDRADTETMI